MIVLGLDSAEPPHHITRILKCSRRNILIVKSLVRNVQVSHDCSFLRSTHKWGCRGRSPLPEREVSPEASSSLCSPPKEASYDWMSVLPLDVCTPWSIPLKEDKI